jgi:hypothetical protein
VDGEVQGGAAQGKARLRLWGPNRDVDNSRDGFSHANTLLPTG